MPFWTNLRRGIGWANAIKTAFEWKAIVTSATAVGLITTVVAWSYRDPAVAIVLGMCAFAAVCIALYFVRPSTEKPETQTQRRFLQVDAPAYVANAELFTTSSFARRLPRLWNSTTCTSRRCSI
jgi:hypothetical protein